MFLDTETEWNATQEPVVGGQGVTWLHTRFSHSPFDGL